MDDEREDRLYQENKKPSAGWWAMLGALLATSAVPCPECGGPLVLHLWPLVVLLVAVRAIADRTRPRS